MDEHRVQLKLHAAQHGTAMVRNAAFYGVCPAERLRGSASLLHTTDGPNDELLINNKCLSLMCCISLM